MLENVRISSDIIAMMEDTDNDTARGTNGSSLSARIICDTLGLLARRYRIQESTRGRDTVHSMIHRSGKVRDTAMVVYQVSGYLEQDTGERRYPGK